MSEFFKVDPRIEDMAAAAEKDCEAPFRRIAEIETYNSEKVLRAFIDNRVSESLFAGSSGYGYDDRGREILDRVWSQVFVGKFWQRIANQQHR